MLILNDSNASCVKNGIAIFMDSIETSEDILINSTCVFMADIQTSASITATYDVIIYGNIIANGNITIGGSLRCNKLECADIYTSCNLTVTGNLKCSALIVGENATIGDAFCENAEIGKTLIVNHTIDSPGSINAQKSIICFDSIVIDGTLNAPCIIVQNECDSTETLSNHVIILSNTDEQMSDHTLSVALEQEISINQASIDDIFNFESLLAVRLEETAGFIDQLQDKLRDLRIEDLYKYINAYADFLPGFSILKKYIIDAEDAIKAFSDGSGSWYEAFCTLAQLYFNLPEWLYDSAFTLDVQGRLTHLLCVFAQSNFKTKSRTRWSKTFNYVSRLLNDPMAKQELIASASEALPKLYSNVGLKTPTIRIFLSED